VGIVTALPDQPGDWTDPGAHPVAHGVFRVPVPLPLDGLKAVNVYFIEDDGGLVVVDSGWAGPATTAALSAAVRAAGHRLDDISQFLVTHAHWDHYTQALMLRDQLKAPVRLGRGERHSIEAYTPDGPVHPEQVCLLRRGGAVELAERVAAIRVSDNERQIPFHAPDCWLDDRDTINLDGRSLEVFATPGHTRGHIVLRDAPGGLLFAGDHVLPHITPSLGFEQRPEPRPLRSYLDSLRLIGEQPDLMLLPAHGPVTASTHVRVEELLTHHEQRLSEVQALVRSGHRDAYAIALAMRWTRRARPLAELETEHQMVAVLEIQAHLDLLADVGELRESAEAEKGGNVVLRYDVA
jgi:glyoxylase-like metal-dependent hydrolase (beta-lactamase superfamily II)